MGDQIVVISGRNYNSDVRLAFLFGSVSGSEVITKHVIHSSCSNHNCQDWRVGRRGGIVCCDCSVDGRYVRQGGGCHGGCSQGSQGSCEVHDAPWRALTTDEKNYISAGNQYQIWLK